MTEIIIDRTANKALRRSTDLKKSPYRIEKGSSLIVVSTDKIMIQADKITISQAEQKK